MCNRGHVEDIGPGYFNILNDLIDSKTARYCPCETDFVSHEESSRILNFFD